MSSYFYFIIEFYILLLEILGEKGESGVVGAVFDKTGRLGEQKENINKVIIAIKDVTQNPEEAEKIIKPYL